MNKYSNLPLVSVCVCVYGRPLLLPMCLNSIINQTYKNLEIIIVHTFFDQQTLNLCNYYKDLDCRIRIIYILKNDEYTISNTLNIAYNASNGKYLCSVDSDDYIENSCIEDCVNNIKDFGLIYTYCKWFGDFNCIDTRAKHPYSKDRLLEFFMVFHFRLFLKSAWNNIDNLTKCNRYYDYDLVLRLSEVTDFILLPKILYYWRRHNNQETNFLNIEEINFDKLLHINNAKKRRGL